MRGARQLAGGLNRERLFGAVELAGGHVAVVALDRRLHVVHADAAAGERVGIQLDAYRVFLPAEDLHLRDAATVEMRCAMTVSAYSSTV